MAFLNDQRNVSKMQMSNFNHESKTKSLRKFQTTKSKILSFNNEKSERNHDFFCKIALIAYTVCLYLLVYGLNFLREVSD